MARTWQQTVVALSLLLVPSVVSAQMFAFLGGGATFPNGDYGDYAKTGWIASGGVGIPVGPPGMAVVVEGFYGQNDHEDVDGDKTNPYGLMVDVDYTFGTPGSIQPYLIGGVGLLVHKFSTDFAGGLSGSDSQFGYTAAAGALIPLGGTVGVYGEGRYWGSADTAFLGILAGVRILLGAKK